MGRSWPGTPLLSAPAPGPARQARLALTLLLPLALLGGCKAVPEIAGVLTGALAGGASGNPAVGFGVGVGVAAGSDYAVKYFGRSRQHAEQEVIAGAAGPLPPGGTASWAIHHTIPFGNEHGTLMVVRDIATPLAACKEVVFSVDEGEGDKLRRHWYDTDICLQPPARWRWATAEPAVPRWGYLQ